MKYLKLFKNHSGYTECEENECIILPNVSLCDEEIHMHYNPEPIIYEHVDLGLPSGTMWATMNIGAQNPQDVGDYFAWGETKTKQHSGFSLDGYKLYNKNEAYYTKYNSQDNLITLEAVDDAAAVNWGGKWRVPSVEQFRELISGTTSGFTEVNGVSGITFSGNGNQIFIPVSGRWSSSQQGTFLYDSENVILMSNEMQFSWQNPSIQLCMNSWGSGVAVENFVSRFQGVAVRPCFLSEINTM